MKSKNVAGRNPYVAMSKEDIKVIITEDKYPESKPEVIEAMEEAKRISRDPNVKHYTDVKEMFKEILEDSTED